MLLLFLDCFNTIFDIYFVQALQAVDRNTFQQDNVVAVTVPWYARPGQMMLVHLNDAQQRIVRTQIPYNAQPGHVFLIQVPPAPTKVPGIPLDDNNHNDDDAYPANTTSATPVVISHEVPWAMPLVQPTTPASPIPEDLLLKEEQAAFINT